MAKVIKHEIGINKGGGERGIKSTTNTNGIFILNKQLLIPCLGQLRFKAQFGYFVAKFTLKSLDQNR